MESWCYFSGDKEHVCDKSVSASGENGGKKSEKQSSCLVVERNSKDSSLVDLKLGSTSDRNETLSLNSSYAAAKRPRPGVWSSQIPFCLVHGCKKDLRSSKEYYKRHKVCEVHSKTAKVIVNGVEQRFCQQCSRFHVLTEFDNEKRSCRRRLAGHNERRRKPRVGVNSTRLGMFQNYNGSTFQDTYSRSSNVLSQQKYEVYDWNRPVKVENGADFCSQINNPVGSEQLHSKSVPISDTSRKQHFPFHVENCVPTRSKIDEINELSMQDHATGSDIGCPPLIFHNSVGSKNAMLMDSSSYILDLSGTLNSGHALSLLSSLSQDSSNLSSRAHLSSQPFSTSDSSASYDLSKVSQKLLAVSNGASTSGMSRVSHSSLRPLSEHHW